MDLDDTQTENSFVAQARDLPGDSRLNFLVAPETYHRLVYRMPKSGNNNFAFVRDALCAERCRIGQEVTPRNPVWTAMGDLYFPAGNVEAALSLPRLLEKITIDGFSPFSTMEFGATPVCLGTHSLEEMSLIVEKLEESARSIERIFPEILQLITLVLKVIVLKQDHDSPQGFGSSSWSSFVGKMGLTNAHLPDVDVALLSNALVHEAIHSLLYMVELREPFYTNQDRPADFRVTSPWTGRSLYLPSYLHACFVWFGLWSFWQLAEEKGVFHEVKVRQYSERASLGFQRVSLEEALIPVRHSLMPGLVDAIVRMQEIVRSS